MRPRKRITSYLIIVVSLSLAASLVLTASASALDLEPFVELIDQGIAPKIDEIATSLEGSSTLPDYFGSADAQTALDRAALGFDPEKPAPTPEEVRNDTDWCLYSGLAQSAVQINNGNTTASDGTQLSPAQILFDNLSSCLGSHIPSATQIQITALANALAYQNEVQFVQSQSNLSAQSASNWLQQYGLTFDPTTWANWFNFAAGAVPPVN